MCRPAPLPSVRDEHNTIVGKAFYSSQSQIALRFLVRGDIPVDDAFFRRRFEDADDLRSRLWRGSAGQSAHLFGRRIFFRALSSIVMASILLFKVSLRLQTACSRSSLPFFRIAISRDPSSFEMIARSVSLKACRWCRAGSGKSRHRASLSMKMGSR